MIFSKAIICEYSFVIYVYWWINSDTFLSNISIAANIFKFSVFSKNGSKWLLLVQNGSLWVQNFTNMNMAKIVQKNLGQKSDIQIYLNNLDKNIHSKSNCWSFLELIYLDIHSWSFYHAKYIQVFICPISMVTNVFVYFLFKKMIFIPQPTCSWFYLEFRVIVFLSCCIYEKYCV